MSDQKLGAFDRELLLYGKFDTDVATQRSDSVGRARSVPCGPLHAVEVVSKNIISRRGLLGGKWADHAIIMLQHDGEAIARQYNHQTWLRPGDMYLMDTCSPLEVTVPDVSRATCIAVARSHVTALASRPEAVFGSKIEGDEGLARLVWHLLGALLSDRHSYDAVEAGAVTASLQLMLSHALKCPPRLVAEFAQPDLLKEIKDWLSRNLDDPTLDVAKIARHFGVSRSVLYRHFATEGLSPQAWLTARRLDEAHRLISESPQGRANVTAICFGTGFNDPSHFSRLFRRRFGITPRELRRDRNGDAERIDQSGSYPHQLKSLARSTG